MAQLVRYIEPVGRRQATGVVADIYTQMATDLGAVVEPLTIMSPVPTLLAATWASLRESLLVGGAPRAEKEAVAAAVAQANRCPWCVDAHTTATYATGQAHLADAVLGRRPAARPEDARLLAWAAATGRRGAPELATPPVPAELIAEYVGVALTFHFVTRMVSALLAETFLPTRNERVQQLLRRAFGRYLTRVIRRERRPGDSLAFLAPQPPTATATATAPAWAGGVVTPIAQAWMALRTGGDPATVSGLISEPARAAVAGLVATWDGQHPPMSPHWLDSAMSGLAPADRPAARLAALAALAAYRITDDDVTAVRAAHPHDADLVRLLTWGAMTAVTRIETWIQPEP